MRQLGYFSYHSVKVTFTANESETLFKVSFFGKGKRKPSQLKEFETLGPARLCFQDCIAEIVSRTSRSTVSIHMQNVKDSDADTAMTLRTLTNLTQESSK